MINSFFGFKQGQTQLFDKQGKRVALTKIKALPLTVKNIKTDVNGGKLLLVKCPKNTGENNFLKEIRLSSKDTDYKTDQIIKMDEVFKEGEVVLVSGITKGSGFAGVVKRWHFHGGPRTHGQSDRQRAPGAIGSGTDPGRVWKGKKMAGHMGVAKRTIKNLKVVKVDSEKNEIWISGLIPGKKGGLVEISKMTLLRHPDENQSLS